MQDLSEQLLRTSQQLVQTGLNRGTSGNASVRFNKQTGEAGFLITPSGMMVDKMSSADMVWMDFSGQTVKGALPSSEWRFHLDILHARPEVGAVIHVHSLYATTLACLRRDIPAFHYMVAVAGGETIRCAPYALFGSQALSDVALQALQGRKACLLANHGMIALGRTLDEALYITQEVETLSAQYLQALQVEAPYILSGEEMLAVQEKFQSYGFLARQK